MKDFLFILFAWLLTLPFLVGAIVFAIHNRADISIIVNPFHAAVTIPLYVPVLCAIAIGFLFGSVMTWAAMGRLRAQKRAQAKQIKLLEKQLDDAKHPAPLRHDYTKIPLKLLGRR